MNLGARKLGLGICHKMQTCLGRLGVLFLVCVCAGCAAASVVTLNISAVVTTLHQDNFPLSNEQISYLHQWAGQRVAPVDIVAIQGALKKVDMELSKEQVLFLRRKIIQQYLRSPEFEKHVNSMNGSAIHEKGIMYAAGSCAQQANALLSIRALREVFKCTLPIEVIYWGKGEVCQPVRDYYEELKLNVTWIDASKVPQPKQHRYHDKLNGFALKAFILAYVTRIKHVIMLDADNVPLSNPATLFDSPSFVKLGNMFWPDFWHSGGWIQKKAYTMFGFAVPWDNNTDHRLTESGEIVLDRVRHADVLELMWMLNSHHDVLYGLMYGDKDTFKIAYFLANKSQEYNQVAVWSREAINEVAKESPHASCTPYHHIGMVQGLPDGRPAFMHRTGHVSKYFPVCSKKPEDELFLCLAKHFSVPLTVPRAEKLFKPHCMGFTADEIDVKRNCTAKLSSGPPTPEQVCNINIRDESFPYQVFPIESFEGVPEVLQKVWDFFLEARKKLETVEW